jgi:hypothetical protein
MFHVSVCVWGFLFIIFPFPFSFLIHPQGEIYTQQYEIKCTKRNQKRKTRAIWRCCCCKALNLSLLLFILSMEQVDTDGNTRAGCQCYGAENMW